MLKIHHLVLSRSDRIVWLAEELGIKYELVRHVRNPENFRSPDSLWKVAPMGKAPAIQDGDITLGESGVTSVATEAAFLDAVGDLSRAIGSLYGTALQAISLEHQQTLQRILSNTAYRR